LPAQNKMIQASFHITTPDIAAAYKQLFIETDGYGLSFYCLHPDTKQFTDCVVYHFDATATDSEVALGLKDIFAREPLLQAAFKKTDIIYAFPECILTPNEVYDPQVNDQMLNEVFGDAAKGVVKTDFVYRHNLHAVYRTPIAINAAITSRFSAANHSHLYSLLPDAFAGEADVLDVICRPGRLLVVLHQNTRLTCIREFETQTPEDTAYYLLRVCACFSVNPQHVLLRYHGMMDKDSALFAALYKYFLHLEAGSLSETFSCARGFAEYPAHFFNHLFAAAICV
jgi:hypothetical protein